MSKASELLLSDTSSIELQKAKVLSEAQVAYEIAVRCYNENNLEIAEKEFVKALKPFLSKPLMRNAYVNIEGFKEELLDSMYKLGNIYLNSPQYADHHSKAAAIFQYCSAFSKEHNVKLHDHGGAELDFKVEAYKVEQAFLYSARMAESGVSWDIEKKIAEYKSYEMDLKKFRDEIKGRVSVTKELPIEVIEARAEEVELIYRSCTNFFVNNGDGGETKPGLLQQLIMSCFEQLGVPPEGCEYSIVGLGSIAGGKMTPWSDLEFAILLNEEKPEYKEYFRNLTKLLHIKVINFGETPLRSVGIESLNNFRTGEERDDWFWDEVMNSGFSFDGADWHACKTPFGRNGGYQTKEKMKRDDGVEIQITTTKPDYELILTPKQMAEFQFTNNELHPLDQPKQDWFSTDKYLVQALRSVSLIDGSQVLLDHYRKEQIADTFEKSQTVKDRALEVLQENIDNFSLKLGGDEEGGLFDVKKGIYRAADRIIDALANYYNIAPSAGQPNITSWEVIGKLLEKEVLSQEGAQHLREALSIATELRLATYAHNNGQKETMSTYIPAVQHLDEARRNEIIHATFHEGGTSALCHFYYIILSVQGIAKELCSEDYVRKEWAEIRLKTELYDDRDRTKGLVSARFLEYGKAIEYLEKARQERGLIAEEKTALLNDLHCLYLKMGVMDKAIESGEEIVLISRGALSGNNSQIYNMIGDAYTMKGDYEKSLECYRKALAEQLKMHHLSPNHPDLMVSYGNLSRVYTDNGEYAKAMEYANKVLEMAKAEYAINPNNQGLAISYQNLGRIYQEMGEYNKALEHFYKALDIQNRHYKSNPNHANISTIYNNLSVLYDLMGEYDKAIESYNKVLAIQRVWCKFNPDHPFISGTYGNLAAVYGGKGEYDKALEFLSEAQRIQRVCYKTSPNHPDIASNAFHFGVTYANQGYNDKAIECYNTALAIRRICYKSNPNHTSIAIIYVHLGGVHCDKGQYDRGIECYLQALEMQQHSYGSNLNHPDIANSYNKLGEAYNGKGQYDRALECFNKALDIQKVCYNTHPNHLNIAKSYNNLCILYYSIGEYDKCIEYNLKALAIKLQAYPVEAHNSSSVIALNYNNLGIAYSAKMNYSKALEYYYKAMEIYSRAYESCPNHPNIAGNYVNLGVVFSVYQKDYTKAIEYYQKALKIYIEIYKESPNHPNVATCYFNLGTEYRAKGDYDKSIEYFSKALKIYLEVHASSPNHPDIASCHSDLGITYRILGEYELSIKHLVDGLDLKQSYYGASMHPEVIRSSQELQEAYHARDSRGRIADNLYAAKAITSSLDYKVEYVFKGTIEHWRLKTKKDPSLIDLPTDTSMSITLTKHVTFVIPEGYGFGGLKVSGKQIHTSCAFKDIQKITLGSFGNKHYIKVERKDNVEQKGIISKEEGDKAFGVDSSVVKAVAFYNAKYPDAQIKFGSIARFGAMQYLSETGKIPPVQWPDNFTNPLVVGLDEDHIVELSGDCV